MVREQERSASISIQDLKVLWITNVASPYRRPLWHSLNASLHLKIALLESDSRLLKDSRRGEDWRAGTLVGLSWRVLATLRIPNGENPLYFLVKGLRLVRDRPHALLIGGWESPAFWQALIMAKLLRIRTVAFYESTLQTNRHSQGVIARARSAFLRSVDAVVVPGVAARRAVESFGVLPGRVHMGFNAVDVVGFHDRAVEARFASQRVGSVGHRFLYVGQLIVRKNVATILDAFASRHCPGDQLTVIGAGQELENLRDLAERLGLREAVQFIDTVANDSMAKTMASSQTLVLASYEEVWGLVVNEALASGLNVVVASTCGVAASVEHMDGVFLSGTDANSVAEAMRRSADSWHGYHDDPQILASTPERFAQVFVEAFTEADPPGNSPAA